MSAHNKQVTRRLVGMIVLCIGLFAAEQSFAATPVKAANPGHIGQTNCVILERMGAVGQVTSRVLSLRCPRQ